MKRLSTILVCIAVLAILFTGCNTEPQESSIPSSSEAVSSEPVVTTSPEASPEATPEATPAAKKGEKPDFGPLSDDLYSYQIQIGEDVYQFPMTYGELISFGWTFNEDDLKDMGPNEYTVSDRATMGGVAGLCDGNQF